MAEIGGGLTGGTTTGGAFGGWWPHPHVHTQHVHAFAMCVECGAQYCLTCYQAPVNWWPQVWYSSSGQSFTASSVEAHSHH